MTKNIAYSCQTKAFIRLNNGKKYTFVQSCCEYRKKLSVLTYKWQLKNTIQRQYKEVNAHHDYRFCNMELLPKLYKISIDSIQKHCLILPYEDNSHFIMHINEPKLWADSFSIVEV